MNNSPSYMSRMWLPLLIARNWFSYGWVNRGKNGDNALKGAQFQSLVRGFSVLHRWYLVEMQGSYRRLNFPYKTRYNFYICQLLQALQQSSCWTERNIQLMDSNAQRSCTEQIKRSLQLLQNQSFPSGNIGHCLCWPSSVQTMYSSLRPPSSRTSCFHASCFILASWGVTPCLLWSKGSFSGAFLIKLHKGETQVFLIPSILHPGKRHMKNFRSGPISRATFGAPRGGLSSPAETYPPVGLPPPELLFLKFCTAPPVCWCFTCAEGLCTARQTQTCPFSFTGYR